MEEVLKSFIPQLKAYKFPIFISDDASSDNTEAMVKKLKHIYPHIFYKRNDKNLGYGLNLVSLLHMGETEYALIFSDDDAIKEGAIDTIVKNLNEGYDFLMINSSHYDRNLTSEVSQGLIKSDKDIIYAKGMHEKLMVSNPLIGYISVIITKKKFLNLQLKKIDLKNAPYEYLQYLQMILYFRAVVNKKGKFISSPLIKIRAGNEGYKNRILEIALISTPRALQMLRPWYSEKTLKEASKLDVKSLVALANMQRKKAPDKILLNVGYVRKSGIPHIQKVIAIAVLTLPEPIVDFTINTFKRLYD